MKVVEIDSKIEVDTILGGTILRILVTKGLGLIQSTSELTQERDGSETTRDMEEEVDQGRSKQEEIARDQIVDQDEIVDKEVSSEIEVSPWIDQRVS